MFHRRGRFPFAPIARNGGAAHRSLFLVQLHEFTTFTSNIYLRLTIATTPVGRSSYAFSPVTVSYESSIQSLYIASVGAFYDT